MNDATLETRAGEFTADVRHRAESLAGQAAGAAESAYEQARGHVRGATAEVEAKVRQEPLLAAMAIGLVCGAVGWLLAKR